MTRKLEFSDLTPRLEAAFWSRVHVSVDGCWLWQGTRNPHGYGVYQPWIRGLQRLCGAHRLAFMLTYGPIPDGQCVCHTCDTPACVRPGHLWLGTPADNWDDMRQKGRHRGAPGTRNQGAKIDRHTADMIRADYARGKLSQAVLGEIYGLSQPQISVVIRRAAWSD